MTIAIEPNPLLVPPQLAAKLKDAEAALIVQQIHYWLEKEAGEVIDGVRWIYNTLEQWLEQFPWMTKYKLRKKFGLLRELGIVKFAQHDKKRWDRKGYYTIDDDRLKALVPSTCRNSNSRCVENETIDVSIVRTSYTETTPETSTEKKEEREEKTSCFRNGEITEGYEEFLKRLILKFKNPVVAVEAWLEKNASKKSFQREFLKSRSTAQGTNVPPRPATNEKLESFTSFSAALGRNKAKWQQFPAKRQEVMAWVEEHCDRVRLGENGPELRQTTSGQGFQRSD